MKIKLNDSKIKVRNFYSFFFSIPLIVLSSKAKQRYHQIHDRLHSKQ